LISPKGLGILSRALQIQAKSIQSTKGSAMANRSNRLVWFGVVLAFAIPTCANDVIKPGSHWHGSIKLVQIDQGSQKKLSTADCRMVILKRDKDKFEGELWCDNDKRGIQLVGTVNVNAVRFTATKKLRGDSSDVVNNLEFVGRLNMNDLKGRYTIPGSDSRYGEIDLKLKE
jgi:hypothetical protein